MNYNYQSFGKILMDIKVSKSLESGKLISGKLKKRNEI